MNKFRHNRVRTEKQATDLSSCSQSLTDSSLISLSSASAITASIFSNVRLRCLRSLSSSSAVVDDDDEEPVSLLIMDAIDDKITDAIC